MTTFERTSVASWKRCNLCYDIVFKTPNEFSLHLRNNHCKKEGGSYVCCYGKNNVCGSLPLEGVSDQDYEFHVVKHHVLSLIGDDGSFQEENFVENLRQKYAHILTANEVHQQPNVVLNQCEWSVYSSTQNLPAVLNDPRRTKREWDLFTKTWGDGFTESACLPSCPYIPEINWIHFESYLKQTGKHFLRHSRQALKRAITDKKCISPVSKTGHPFVTKLSTISAEIEDVPKIFMQADFSLENPETFSQVLPWSQLYGQKSENSSRKNSVKLLQEKLSHYLDIVEVQIARQISMRSEAFFHAMTSHDALMDQLTHVIKCVCELRSKIHAIEDILVTGPMKIMRLKRTQGNFLHVYNKLKLMATVHQTQPTIQLLLSTSEFVGALDLIYTTQEVLSQELAGIHSFRHLSSQLAEIEKVIDKMMQTDFVRYVTADLNRPHQEGSFVMEEDRLVAILLGMLRKHQYTFIEIYKDECYTAVKTMVKQTIIEVISQADDILESNTGNLSEQLRSLNFSTWIRLLKQVFANLNFLLERIQALYQVMQETTNVAAGHFCSPTDSFHQWPAIQILDGENEVMVAEQDYMRVKANLKDLLCSVCEHAHECCGKLLSGRTRDGSLDKLTTSDFVLLAQGVESFQTSCEAICGKQGTSLRLALQSQANKFVNRFHEERKTKLSLILENEQWKQAEVPMEFQEIVNHIVSSGSLTLLKKNADDDPGERKPQKYLIVNSENYAVSGTVLLLLRMVIEYCQCVEDVPMLASDLGTRLLDLLKTFNSRTCQLVLGAGALQLVGLKTISIKHLALASRCLQLLVCFIPLAKEHFESRIHSKQQIITKHFEQTLKVYNEHIHEIQQKVECIIGDMFETQLRKWEVKAPVPSPCFNEISKQLNKVYELLHGLLPSEQIQKIFIIAHSTFKVKLRFHLARLHVNNDGGPKHGLVTQELTFYTQNLKKLNVPCNLNYNMNELWLHR